MKTGYYATAWADIKNSPGWFGKMCLLALITLIPIFGPIVAYGYLYGWARDIAWDVHQPLPQHIFGNEDGKLYSRGFFALVITFVFMLIPSIIQGVFTGAMGATAAGTYGSESSYANAVAAAGFVGFIVSLLLIVLYLAAGLFAWIGTMRMSIYGRLSAGFQFGKIWNMFRHDSNGIFRILGMIILVGMIIGIALSIVMAIVCVIAFAAGAASLMPYLGSLSSMGSYGGYSGHYGLSSSDGAAIFAALLPTLGVAGFLLPLSVISVWWVRYSSRLCRRVRLVIGRVVSL